MQVLVGTGASGFRRGAQRLRVRLHLRGRPSCPLVAEPDGGGSGGAGGSAESGAEAGAGGVDAGAGGSAGTAGATEDGGPDTDAAVDAPNDAPSCATEQPNQEHGIFVSADGKDSGEAGTCGAVTAPCATVKKALSIAKAGGVVYIAAGTYEEDGLTLGAGVTLQGGWVKRVDGGWIRRCDAARSAAVVIRAKSADRTLGAVDLQGSATVEAVTVESKATTAATAGSVYGIFVSGAKTGLILREVAIKVQDAGAGNTGDAGQDGLAAAASCASGSGANGATIGQAGSGALAGSFSSAGYAPVPGIEGRAGGDGQDGTPAPAPPCVTCGQGASCIPQCTPITCLRCGYDGATYQQCGKAGNNGCRGGGGKGGKPGSGGGSSIGIFVWDGTVRIETGRIESGSGGNGGPGGPGGQGAVGTLGAPGSAGGLSCQTCAGSNVPPDFTCHEESQAAGPGAPGGPGGSGKDGGPGGGGAGGHSYAIYKGGSAVVNVAPGVELVAGAPGSGGGVAPGSGADGSAKPIGP